jgi:glycerophosphoryl diester phosphodiesterase
MPWTYTLRAPYVGNYTGGVIRVTETRSYNVGTGLTAGGGTITVPDDDPDLAAALVAYPPLQQTGAPPPPVPTTPAFVGQYRGKWKSSTYYEVNDRIIRPDTGVDAVALVGHTSAAAFTTDAAKWQPLRSDGGSPDSIAYPAFIPHRGGYSVAPAHCDRGLEAALAGGAQFLETDLVVGTDGSIFNVHGQEMADSTDGSGDGGLYDAASFNMLRVLGSKFHTNTGLNAGGSGYPDDGTVRPLTLARMFALFGGVTPIRLDIADVYNAGTKTVDRLERMIRRNGLERAVMAVDASYPNLVDMANRIPGLALGYGSGGAAAIPAGKTISDLLAINCRWVSGAWLTDAASQARAQSYIAGGLTLGEGVFDRLSEIRKRIALAPAGRWFFWTDSHGRYLNPRVDRMKRDPFAKSSLPFDGWFSAIAIDGSTTSASSALGRGKIAGGKFYYDAADATDRATFHGWASPMGGMSSDGMNDQVPTTGSVQFDLTFDSISAGKFAGIFLAMDDSQWVSAVTPTNGYRFRVSAAGVGTIIPVVGGGARTPAA